MNDFPHLLPTAGASGEKNWARRAAGLLLEITRRGLALVLVWLMVPLGVADLSAFAQEAPPPPPDQSQGAPPDQGPPPQAYNALSAQQLNQLVAPIALYPDSLVAQVLAAATFPTQVVDADRFVQSQGGAPPDQIAQMANNQPWDPSVKALTAFPSVLSNMDKNLDWTTQLGNAYYNQPQDVMGAVQAMRAQAYQSGQLRSTPQLSVTYAPGDVVIAPVNPAVVYVPYYNPWVVYGFHPWYAWYAPPPPPGFMLGAGIAIGFGIGIAIGAWTHWGWGWGHWGVGWGPHPFVAFNHVSYVSRSVTVINHGYYGRFDRAPGAIAYNRGIAAHAAAAGYNRGYAAGDRAGYNAGARTGYNRGAANSYRAPANNTYRPAQNNSFNRAGANRAPASNYRAAPGNSSHPAPGNSHPAAQSHPSSSGHPASHPSSSHSEGGHEKGHGR